MTITRWTPLHDFSVLQNRLNSIFQDFPRTGVEAGQEALTSGNFVPPVDIYEDDQKLVLKLEVPGIKQEDLDIRVENNTLTIQGERKFAKEEKEENFHRIERRYGNFVRSFTLPNTIDTDKITANYDAGILAIELAKRAEAKPKQIKVAVNSAKQVENKPAA
ncbi:MAG: Hsp20/alpha crystallin family protein [Acidobacteriaceae bacterium]